MAMNKEVRLEFSRRGGCTIRFDGHVWRMGKTPTLVDSFQFKDFKKPAELDVMHLPTGEYQLIGIATVLLSVSPTYQYTLTLDGQSIAERDDEVSEDASDIAPEQFKHVIPFQVTA